MNLRQYVPETTWMELLANGRRRFYSPGAPLMTQGGAPDSVIALIQGTVKVTEDTPDGQVLPLALRGPGELLGEVGALHNEPRSASVRSVTRCVGYSISASAFRALVEREQLLQPLHRLSVNRTREKEAHLRSLQCDPNTTRMARFLAHLAHEVGEKTGRLTKIHLGMDRTELGLMLRMSRATAIDALGRLKALELIQCGRKHIEVSDIDRLCLYATNETRDVTRRTR